MKSCYINATDGMQIRLDGPALSIHAPGQAATLTPLRRISRIIISGAPECSAAVLLACAERGITVTFLQANGAIRAHLFGQSMAENDLFRHLRDLLDRPDWPERYQLWLESAASRARVSICRKLGMKPDNLTLQQVCRGMNQYMEQFISAKSPELSAKTPAGAVFQPGESSYAGCWPGCRIQPLFRTAP